MPQTNTRVKFPPLGRPSVSSRNRGKVRYEFGWHLENVGSSVMFLIDKDVDMMHGMASELISQFQ